MIRALAWVWLGIAIGISFIATPVKFTAETVNREQALDVGRVTFRALSWTEWILSVMIVGLVWLAFRHRQGLSERTLIGVAVVLAMVIIQSVWLIPELTDRINSIIAGNEPPSSPLHAIYAVTEGVKVIALALVGYWVALPTPSSVREPEPVG